MSLAVAIQMDPIEDVDIDADSTFVLALEAQAHLICVGATPISMLDYIAVEVPDPTL